MYWIDQEKKEDLRRNTLSIRFTDREHQLVCDTAWKKRVSASGMIRDILMGEFERLGILDQKETATVRTQGQTQEGGAYRTTITNK